MASTCADEGLFTGALALISDAHRAAALAHPRWLDIAQEPDPARQLVWMVRQRLLTYDELDDLQSFDEEPSDADRIVEEAFAELGRQDAIGNCRLLDQLLADGLITPAQHGAMRNRPLDEPHDDAASLLFAFVNEDIMSPDDFHALHADVLSEPASRTASRRRQTVMAAYNLLQADEAWERAYDQERMAFKIKGYFYLACFLAGPAILMLCLIKRWPA